MHIATPTKVFLQWGDFGVPQADGELPIYNYYNVYRKTAVNTAFIAQTCATACVDDTVVPNVPYTYQVDGIVLDEAGAVLHTVRLVSAEQVLVPSMVSSHDTVAPPPPRNYLIRKGSKKLKHAWSAYSDYDSGFLGTFVEDTYSGHGVAFLPEGDTVCTGAWSQPVPDNTKRCTRIRTLDKALNFSEYSEWVCQNAGTVNVVEGSTFYIADTDNHCIRTMNSTTYEIGFLAGGIDNTERGYSDGVGQEARFLYPFGLSCNRAGNIYVTDTNNHLIRKITPQGTVTTAAGVWGPTTIIDGDICNLPGYVDGSAAEARFNKPTDCTFDLYGNCYIADNQNNCVRKLTSVGVVTTLAVITSPFSITFDPVSNCLYATSDGGTSARRIVKITLSGIVTFISADLANKRWSKLGISCDEYGNIYVSEIVGRTLKRVTPSGTVTLIAGDASGNGYPYGHHDGLGAAVLFETPGALVVAKDKNIYMTDSEACIVWKITPAGLSTTIAGAALDNIAVTDDSSRVPSDPYTPGYSDGIGPEAMFNYPCGIAEFSLATWAVEISYTVKNVGASAKNVGLRCQIDTDVNSNDANLFLIPKIDPYTGEANTVWGVIGEEHVFTGDEIPSSFFTIVNETDYAHVSSFVVRFDDDAYPPPDKLWLASWSGIMDVWAYSFRPPYPTPVNSGDKLRWQFGDSAAATYWNEAPLSSGESRTYKLYYGIGAPPSETFVSDPSRITPQGGKMEASDDWGIVFVHNQYLAVQTIYDTQHISGQFNIGAYPDNSGTAASDEGYSLSYIWPHPPGTSTTLLSVNGVVAGFGLDYLPSHSDVTGIGVVTSLPVNVADDETTLKNVTVWQFDNVEVTQELRLVEAGCSFSTETYPWDIHPPLLLT